MKKKNKAAAKRRIKSAKKSKIRQKARPAPVLSENKNKFPIVGIGASAGGLAAFEAFFSGMPVDKDPGMAFVLVQHLSPDHKSILSELVRRYTRMEVFEVTDGMRVRPNCTYIIPPGRDMALLNGSLHLFEPNAPRGQHLPIDFFFRSLAQDLRDRAICIVLSGTGSDGTLGVRAIKGEGGMAMVQNPENTEYDGMPRNAIATGLVDYILPAAEMPAQLTSYTSRTFGKMPHILIPMPASDEGVLKKIFVLLRSQTGHDFSHYKQNTIIRRIERRMAVNQINRLDGYMHYLQQSATEVEALFRDLLIGVTSFFRDPEVFKALEKQVVPSLFMGKQANATVRVWVPGCSTGEEAYSIAILLQEEMEKQKQTFSIQVFAADIDSVAIATARAGIYPANIATDISKERLTRFFSKESVGGTFRINKNIRDMLIFSEQDVIKDPPFSKLDLISCRNLLIYMSGELQKKLIPLFHYSLIPGGFLLLGTSETIGDFQNLFTAIDRKAKLYQRKGEPTDFTKRSAMANVTLPVSDKTASSRHIVQAGRDKKNSLRDILERAMLQQYAPAGALIDERGVILYLHGRTGLFLEPAQGEAGMNILKMAREGLRRDLTTALHKAVTHKKPVFQKGLRVKTNGDFTTVDLTVRPITLESGGLPESKLFLVVLEEAPDAERGAKGLTAKRAKGSSNRIVFDAQIAVFKQELKAKEEYLQSTLEELETTNEELKSSNEELQSVNEELQSTNEELETSKEELQSVNEELATVNTELQTKVTDLSRTNNDMNNLLAATGVGTIFVDLQLRIQRFTPAITQTINLITADVGRPVGHIVSNLKGYDRLVEDAQAVLDTLIPKEIEVQTKEEKWYLLRIMPYRTTENVIEGLVISFTNITELKKYLKSHE